jgi:CDP-paratose 2-epimerase
MVKKITQNQSEATALMSTNGNRQHGQCTVITGGAGFIGTNVAHRLLKEGGTVRIFDNLSRPGVEQNLQWLTSQYGTRLQIVIDDIRDASAVRAAVRDAGQVFHFAAQVAVTTSIENPTEDFEVNLRGTLNLLEALRALKNPPPLLFTSTNKVYGDLEDIVLRGSALRYDPKDEGTRLKGVSEFRSLSFHSPYGCSKGAADQYVLDYSRIYGLPTVVFRMSCIYGPHQFGTEDQGWVAHFVIRTVEDQPITLYGDGRQVRDILFVEDLVDAMLLAVKHVDVTQGQAYNIGGGPKHTTSLLELVDLISQVHGSRPHVQLDAWRPGDQRYYVSDITRFQEATGWSPQVSVNEGVGRLYGWLMRARAIKSASLVA